MYKALSRMIRPRYRDVVENITFNRITSFTMGPLQLGSRLWKIIMLLVYFSYICHFVRAKTCTKIDQCSCVFDDGSGTVDLSSLGLQGGIAL